MRATCLPLVSAMACLLASPLGAAAEDDLQSQPKAKAPEDRLIGLTEVKRIEPDEGLIDVAIAGDGAGLLAYVTADAASKAEVHILDTAGGEELRTVDISRYTIAPKRLWFTGKGKDSPILVVGPPLGEEATGTLKAWLLDPKAKAKKGPKAFGPGDAIVLAERKGKKFVAVRTTKETKKGTVHTFTRFDLKKGKKDGKPRTLTLAGGRDEKLGFTFHHWTADGMIAVGMKEGEWDKKEGIRMPDAEARIDLLDPKGKPKTAAIADLREHARAWDILANEGGRSVFARIADDLSGIEVFDDDQRYALGLDVNWTLYEPKTMTWAVGDDGTLWIGMSIDPWNRPAVDRKKADPEYFDLFRVADRKTTRVGRVYAPKARFSIGASAGVVWMLERNVGFDRGGKVLTIYTPASTTM